MNCEACNKLLSGKQTKFCSRKCKNQACKANVYTAQQARGLERKIELVNMKGGKCLKCGYNRNYAALTFHHRCPEDKSFPLDLRCCSNRSWEKLLVEVAKCDLLCMICHAELHNPELEVGLLRFERRIAAL